MKESADVFKTGEIAHLFQVDRSTVSRWVSQGKLKAFRLPGGEIRILRKDLVQFLQNFGLPTLEELCPTGKEKKS